MLDRCPRRVRESHREQQKGPKIMLNKDAYVAKLEAQIKEWSAQLDEVATKAQKLTADARVAAQKQLEEGRSKLTAARHKLDGLKGVGADKWEEAKAKVESFWKEARTAFERKMK